MGYCDVPKGNTDVNFVGFGNADLPFLLYSALYPFLRLVNDECNCLQQNPGHIKSLTIYIHSFGSFISNGMSTILSKMQKALNTLQGDSL